jgi:hypothetical protein
MPIALRLALAIEVILVLLEKVTPASINVLPLFGDHFTELATLVVAAMIYLELTNLRPR